MENTKSALILLVTVVVSACGGGGDGGGSNSTPPPTTAPSSGNQSGTAPSFPLPDTVPATTEVPSGFTKAIFKDTNVAGLDYVAGSMKGVTAPDGSFAYQKGKSVDFSVGAVSLGSLSALQTALGDAAFTVVDLVSNGSTSSPGVVNRVRFLMMLDSDGNPDNGITISNAVQAAAATWSPVDFEAPDLAMELATIMSSVSNLDDRTAVLPDAATAQAHIEYTLRCVRGGAFAGTFDGDASGRLFLVASLTKGGMAGAMYDQVNGTSELVGEDPVSLDLQGSFVVVSSSSNMLFAGTYYDNDSIVGIWNNTPNGTKGTFQAKRVGEDNTAVYRLAAIYTGTDTGFMTYDLHAGGTPSGVVYSIRTNMTEPQAVKFDNGNLSATTSSRLAINGSFDPGEGTLGGAWTIPGTASGGFLVGQGCRLN